MSNSHRPPDATRQCCLCRVRRRELSLETVWQSLNSRWIIVVAWRLVKKFRFTHMQQSTACLHFAWRTTSLRVGGRAARRSCLRRGGRQAGATVLSCLMWRCELDDCSERVQTPNFLSATVFSCRESSSHRRSGRDTDKTVLSCPVAGGVNWA